MACKISLLGNDSLNLTNDHPGGNNPWEQFEDKSTPLTLFIFHPVVQLSYKAVSPLIFAIRFCSYHISSFRLFDANHSWELDDKSGYNWIRLEHPIFWSQDILPQDLDICKVAWIISEEDINDQFVYDVKLLKQWDISDQFIPSMEVSPSIT